MVKRHWVGQSIRRREDPRLLTGKGSFLDDVRLSRMCFAAMLRSPYAHARIRSIETGRALERAGVLTVLTGNDLVQISDPLPGRSVMEKITEYPLAVNKVTYQGQPVAIVAATDRAIAEDAIDDLEVDYEPLETVLDPEEVVDGKGPVIVDQLGSNIAWHGKFEYGDVEGAFGSADLVVKEKFKIPRYATTPLEPNGCIASYDHDSGILTIRSNAQTLQSLSGLSRAVRVPPSRIRFIIGDLGGGFGTRTYARDNMVLLSLLSIQTGRPIKYVEDRREMMCSPVSQSHSGIYDLELALKRDGQFLAVRLMDITEEGASTVSAGQWYAIKLTNIVGMYRIKNISHEGYSVITNMAPAGAARGLAKPHMGYMLERLVDIAARKLDLDPVEIRRINLIQPNEMPYRTPSGNIIDGGDFPATLNKALEMLDLQHWKKKKKESDTNGRFLGIGIACNVDPGGHNPGREILLGSEPRSVNHRVAGAVIRVDPNGKVDVSRSSINFGTGHETTLAQAVADELGVGFEDVFVGSSLDTQYAPWTTSSGTAGDLYSSIYLGAAMKAATKVAVKMRGIAAKILDTKPEEIELGDGRAFVTSSPDQHVTVKEIATTAYQSVVGAHPLPEGFEMGLHEAAYFKAPLSHIPDEKNRISCHYTYGNQAHAAVIEIDGETGSIEILKYVVAHDSGTLINPMLVEGQIHGHVWQFISISLGEQCVYDGNGQHLTSTFADYFSQGSADSTSIEVAHLETPSTWAPLGTKAVGEGPTIPVMATIANAIEDALVPLGVKMTEIPMTAETVLRSIRSKRHAEDA